MKIRLVLVGLAVITLCACSTPKIIKEPTVLAPIMSNYSLSRDWQVETEALPNRDSEGLFFSEDAQNLYVANSTGYVTALKKTNQSNWVEQVAWQAKFSSPILSGPAITGKRLIVGTAKGQVMALSTADGQILWHTQLSSEVLSHAVISEQKIFTITVDGKVYALNVKTGAIIWVAEHQAPKLSLRGIPPVVVYEDKVFVAWGSGNIQALSAKSGVILWETRIAVSKGRTDLERMVDIQSGLVIKQGRLIAMGFHGKLVSINPNTGNLFFVKEVSGYRDLVVDNHRIYVVDDKSILYAFDLLSGAQIWKQDAFKNRMVGDLIFYKDELLVVDGWGYLHWINTVQGTESSRAKHSNEYGDGNHILRINVKGSTITLLDDEGTITRYQVKISSLAPFSEELVKISH